MLERTKFKWFWRGLCIGLAVIGIGVFYVASAQPDSLVHIYFLDVGQGDSIFIKTADNHKILIDGGPDANVVGLLDHLLPAWDRKLDLVMLTHPHADHATGLIEVLKRYRVGEFLFNGMAYDSMTYNALLQLVQDKYLNTTTVDIDHDYDFGQARLDILYPSVDDQPFGDPNDSSIVSNFYYGSFALLLTGDASAQVEKTLIQRGLLSDVDVLKVAHQGSRTSTSQDFIDITNPEVGVILVGPNQFGHPHAEVVDRLRLSGVQLYRTDQNGTVEIVTDGTRYQVKANR